MSRLHHTRRRTHRLGKFLLFCVLCAVFFWWSNHSLQTERAVFTSPRLPAGFDGCTIVQLSDLHGAEFGEDNEELIRRVREAEPDYIFLTGDLLDRYRQTPRSYAVSLGKSLAGIAPTYFVTGNHEWAFPDIRTLKRELRDAGVTVLSNEYVPLSRGGDRILLAGIDDPNGFADQKTPEELAGELRGAEPDAFWMLLAHRNNYFEKEYSLLGADLVISGHGHGGLVGHREERHVAGGQIGLLVGGERQVGHAGESRIGLGDGGASQGIGGGGHQLELGMPCQKAH